jgi:hypothetical protein
VSDFWVPLAKKLFFGIIMGAFMYLVFKSWDVVLDTAKTINVFILTFSTIIPGYCIYFWLLYISKDREIELLEKFFRYAKKLMRVK